MSKCISVLGFLYYQSRRLPIQKQMIVKTTWRETRNFYSNDNDDDDDDDDSEDGGRDDNNSNSSPLSSISGISEVEPPVGDMIASLNNDIKQNENPPYHQKKKTSTTPVITSSLPKSSSSRSSDCPPTLWAKSTAKQGIINELSDPTSDIHLFIGQFTVTNFANANFKILLKDYAGNKYKLGKFREKMKQLLVYPCNKTGPYVEVGGKKNVVEKWYTSINTVSKANSLLFSLLMNDVSSTALSHMTVEDIWHSDQHFQQYELVKFNEYYKIYGEADQQTKASTP
jgi:hypothetical protein